jgi:hypothetical protein
MNSTIFQRILQVHSIASLRMLIALCLLVISDCMLSRVAVAQGPPVLGDQALLDVLREAQKANKDRYPHGRLTVELESGIVGDEKPGEVYRTTIEWNGVASHAFGVLRLPKRKIKQPQGLEDSKPIVFESIVDRAYNARAFETGKIVLFDALDRVSAMPQVMVRPDQLWYGESRPWVELLGPHPNFPQDNVQNYRVESMPGGLVSVFRTNKNGSGLEIIASLQDDGNIISCDPVNGKTQKKITYKYKWERDSAGNCFLREYNVKMIDLKPGSKEEYVTGYRHYRIIDFDPNFIPPATSLDPTALLKKEGYHIQNNVTGKRFTNRPTTDTTQRDMLEKLILEMRKRGFAAPERVAR